MQNNIERKVELCNLLAKNPRWIDILEEALQVESKGEAEHKDKDYEYLGFEWFECHAQPLILHRMVSERVLDITFSSRSSTHYKVRDPELVSEAIKVIKAAKVKTSKVKEIPKDLFNIIVGHERIKWAFKASLGSKEPVHILLVGPVATAKTLFLSELSRLPESRYVLGSASSKAGIVDYLLEYRPRYLVIDEIEKSDGRDLTALLSLMQTGIVTRLKKHMRERIVLKTWVFGGANSIKRLPQEIKSRFLIIRLKEYSEAEFRRVALSLLEREGVDNSFGGYIVDKVLPFSRDVRDVLKVGRLAKNKEDVDKVVAVIK